MSLENQIKRSCELYKITGDEEHLFDVVTLKMMIKSRESKHLKEFGAFMLVLLVMYVAFVFGWYLWIQVR